MVNNLKNNCPNERKQVPWEDFAFFSLTLRRHSHPEEADRSYVFGVYPDDAQGRKAIRVAVFRTLHWELVREGRTDYGEWMLLSESRSNPPLRSTSQRGLSCFHPKDWPCVPNR